MPLLRLVSIVGLLAAVLWGSALWAQTPVRNPANDHYYALIVLPTPITWQDASNAARNSQYRGRPGYLATITSAQENNFIRAHVYTDPALPAGYSVWLGGFRLPVSEGAKGDWRWVTGEPWVFTYWAKGEPNNANGQDKTGTAENRLIADGPRAYAWNDLRDNGPQEAHHVDILAYVVEYGRAVIPTPRKGIVRKAVPENKLRRSRARKQVTQKQRFPLSARHTGSTSTLRKY